MSHTYSFPRKPPPGAASPTPDTRRRTRRLLRLLRLLRRAGSDGECCDLCGRAFANRDTTYIGYTHQRKLADAGECCVDHLVKVEAIGVYLSPQPGGPWVKADQAWFASHPARTHCLRAAYPNEWRHIANADELTHTLVRQLAPGARHRVAAAMPPNLLEWLDQAPSEAALDEVLWVIFDRHLALGPRVVKPAEHQI